MTVIFMITFDDFKKIELKVAKILEAKNGPVLIVPEKEVTFGTEVR